MVKRFLYILTMAFVLGSLGCMTSPEVSDNPPARDSALVLASEAKFLADGALLQGNLVEGIQNYLTALWYLENNLSPGPEEAVLLQEIQSILTGLENQISLYPTEEWFEDDLQSISVGNSQDPAYIRPSVYVQRTTVGGGRSLIPDAPVVFSVLSGDLDYSETQRSNDIGIANSSLGSMDLTTGEIRVRAQLIFTVGGQQYAFSSVFRDFSYQAPRNALIYFSLENRAGDWYFLESGDLGVETWISQIWNENVPLAGDYTPQAISANTQALFQSIQEDTPGRYLLRALLFSQDPIQLVENGVARNIHNIQGRMEIQIYRLGSQNLLYSLGTQRITVLGGTPQQARENLLERLREEFQNLVDENLDEITQSLEGL